MFDALNRPLGIERYRLQLPKFLHVQNGLKENLYKHQSHYTTRLQRVDSQHLLVRLIHSSPMPWGREARPFIDAARDLMYEVTTSLDMTSNVNAGTLHHPGVFYGHGVKECLLVHDTPFDTFADWTTLQPVEVMSHPVSDLNLQPLDGGDRAATGHAVITINYPMLLWVFRQWRNDPTRSTVSDDYQLSVGHFVHMHLLPQLMGSHLDLVVFNRLYNDLFELPDVKTTHKSSFYLIDYSEKLDRVLGDYLEQIERRSLTVEELVSSVPTVEHSTLYELLTLPDILQNRQTTWALWLARVKILKVIAAYDYLTNNRKNQTFQKQVVRTIRRTLRSRWLPSSVMGLEGQLTRDLEQIEAMMA